MGKNYQSWIEQSIFNKIIKYEDLNNKTFDTFKEIIEFIEITISSKNSFNRIKAKNSIQSTSFDKMREIENKKGFVESVLSKNYSKKIPFFHLGPKNNWKNIFDQKSQEKLNSIFEENLKELKYI